jgi:gluconolactonase
VLFTPPQDVKTEVFAELPTQFRKQGNPSPWLKAQLRGRDLHSLLEAPTFDREGRLYVVDVAYGRIFRVSPAGQFELVIEYDGEPNGLALHKDGRMFVADHKNGILILDTASGELSTHIDRPRLERFKGTNDLTFSKTGDLYFTDQGQTGLQDPTGRVYRLAADGRLDCILDGIPSPNGLVLDQHETALYVAVTRANAIWRAPFLLDGTVSKVGVYVQLSGMGGPDGMALDAEGGLSIAHIDLGSVWIMSPIGEPELRVRSCTGLKTTNVAYGDPDMRSLYITEAESGTILRARLPRPGRVLFSHQQ